MHRKRLCRQSESPTAQCGFFLPAMGYFSRAIRADIEKGSRYFRRSDNTPFGRNAAAEVSMIADKRGHGFHLSTIREKFTYISIRRQQATALQKNPNIAKRKSKNALFIPSAHLLHPRPPPIFQRACRQCVHESARLFRVICSHAWYG